MPASPRTPLAPLLARAFLYIAIACVFILPALAHAQTPAPDLTNQAARAVSGPYDITVVTRIKTPTAGLGTRFTVRVLSAATQKTLDGDLDIIFIGVRPDGTEAGRVEFPQLRAFPEFYEYPITLDRPGTWRYTIAVESIHGVGTVDGEITVIQSVGGGAGGVAIWLAVIVILIGGAFLLYRTNKKRPQD